jgi:Protein of unknown function (DUF4235)
MRFLFAPIGIVAGLVAGFIATKLFDFVWSRISDEEAPEPDQREVSIPMLAAALVLEGAIFRFVRGFVDRGTRRGFARLTGAWPGEERPEKT